MTVLLGVPVSLPLPVCPPARLSACPPYATGWGLRLPLDGGAAALGPR
jgi:hypothetical protein